MEHTREQHRGGEGEDIHTQHAFPVRSMRTHIEMASEIPLAVGPVIYRWAVINVVSTITYREHDIDLEAASRSNLMEGHGTLVLHREGTLTLDGEDYTMPVLVARNERNRDGSPRPLDKCAMAVIMSMGKVIIRGTQSEGEDRAFRDIIIELVRPYLVRRGVPAGSVQ